MCGQWNAELVLGACNAPSSSGRQRAQLHAGHTPKAVLDMDRKLRDAGLLVCDVEQCDDAFYTPRNGVLVPVPYLFVAAVQKRMYAYWTAPHVPHGVQISLPCAPPNVPLSMCPGSWAPRRPHFLKMRASDADA